MFTMEDNMRRVKLMIVFILLSIAMIACDETKGESVSLEEISSDDLVDSDERKTIFVHVCGAVQKEGVYELPEESRVYELIELAGGFRNDAAKESINQATTLEDGMQLYVPTTDEVKESQSGKNSKINLNKASKEQLMTLPGVGEAKAETILQYRNDHGPFRKIEDIMNVTGIKEALFSKIKELITV